jgi:hypothetical protein
MGATRGLTFSRGSLNEVGLECFSLILIGLFFTMFVGGPWQGASETRGGMSIWLVLLPCAYFFVFGANAGRHLLHNSPEDWRPTLRFLTGATALLASPVLLLVLQRFRDRLTARPLAIALTLPLLPVLVLFALTPIITPAPPIDVFFFQLQAAKSLLVGLNPYAINFDNVYGGSGLYPSGVPDSYPYPPMSFAFALVGHALGDVRWPLIACHVAAAALLFGTARQRRLPLSEAIIFGGMFLYLPHAPFVSEQAWIDPTVAFSLGLMSFFLARRQPAAALWAAGLVLASKQTMAMMLPLLWGLWRRIDRSHLIPVFAIGAVTYGVFLLWNASALWDDVVRFHLHTPFRPTALTYSAYISYLGGTPLPPWVGVVALVVSLTATTIRLRRGEGDPCDGDRVWLLYAGLGFVYLVTSLLSKHAFMNYYYLVYFALVAALVWSRVADVEDGAQLVNPTLHR